MYRIIAQGTETKSFYATKESKVTDLTKVIRYVNGGWSEPMRFGSFIVHSHEPIKRVSMSFEKAGIPKPKD